MKIWYKKIFYVIASTITTSRTRILIAIRFFFINPEQIQIAHLFFFIDWHRPCEKKSKAVCSKKKKL